MTEHVASRTLVKSPPELWAECSDASSLARHLDQFGEIRITRLEPETAVAWEGERARGTVRIEPSGWGTKVILTAVAVAAEPLEAYEPPAALELPYEPEPPNEPETPEQFESQSELPVQPNPLRAESAGDPSGWRSPSPSRRSSLQLLRRPGAGHSPVFSGFSGLRCPSRSPPRSSNPRLSQSLGPRLSQRYEPNPTRDPSWTCKLSTSPRSSRSLSRPSCPSPATPRHRAARHRGCADRGTRQPRPGASPPVLARLGGWGRGARVRSGTSPQPFREGLQVVRSAPRSPCRPRWGRCLRRHPPATGHAASRTSRCRCRRPSRSRSRPSRPR